MMIYGIEITISPDTPKMTLAPDVTVSPEFRQEINAWMVEFFGTTNIVPDGQTYYLSLQDKVIMNPRTYAAMRQQLKGQQ